MEAKKTKLANLENKRGVFLSLGFLVSLSLILVAFEWDFKDDNTASLFEKDKEIVLEEMIESTIEDEEPEPEQPEEQQEDVIEDIEITEDETKVTDIDFGSVDSEEDIDLDLGDVEPVEVVEKEDNTIYNFAVIEKKPTFPGGNDKIMKWIGKNTKYPVQARELSIQGTVYVGFVISKTGKVTNVKVKRGADQMLDAEAVRVIRNMPSWSPGKQRNKPVKVSYIIPIKFKLN